MDVETNPRKHLRRSFSFRKISNALQERKCRNKKDTSVLNKSSSLTQLGRYFGRNNKNAGKTTKISNGNLKRSLSFRKTFSRKFRSLPHLNQQHGTEIDTWEGALCHDNDEKMAISVDNIGIKGSSTNGFQKRKYGGFRSTRTKDDSSENTSGDLSKVKGYYVENGNRNNKGMKAFSTKSMRLNLKSRLTSIPEQIDLMDLVKPVSVKSGFFKLPKRHTDKQMDNQLELPNDITEQKKNENSDFESIKDMIYKDNGIIAVAECSPTLTMASPTCADMYGQDENLDLSFNLSPNEILSNSQKVSGDLERTINSEDKNTFTKSGEVVINGNIDKSDNAISDENDQDLKDNNNLGQSNNDSNIEQSDNVIKTDEASNLPNNHKEACIKDELASIVKTQSFETLKEKDLETDCGFDEVDNPWILRTDVPELSIMKQKPDLYKARDIISEISVDESLGFNVNQWNGLDIENENSKRKGEMDTSDRRRLVRSASVESVDSFNSSLHSVHSEDLFFSASEPEMDPDQMSVSSGEFSPGDKSKGLIRIDEADEQVSPNIVKKGEKRLSESNEKDKQDRDMVKSLNDLNKNDVTVKSAPRKISSYLSGLKTFTFESESKGKENKHEKLKQRRSLDSNLKIQQMSLDLNMNESPAVKNKLTNSSDSGLNSKLSPVGEKTNRSSKKTRRRTVDVVGDDDTVKFFTLPTRRKIKSDAKDSPRRKVTRISSISKMFSDKAQSLSNIRLGSSFKLRNNESEKPRVPSFLKTSSLTNLMARKGAEMASSISTLIRGRSNSNTAVDSPFKQKEKPKKTNEEEKCELLYEVVRVPCAKKRPATTEEIAAWKKRLTLRIELAKSLSKEDAMRFRADSMAQRPNLSGSGSENGSIGMLRSPTLLDEIMKSVDNTRFKSLSSACEFDFGETDDEDSSNEGTTSCVFSNQTSVMSDGSTNLPFQHYLPTTVCHKCGHVDPNACNTGKVKQNRSLSLCNIRKQCDCSYSKYKCLMAKMNSKSNSQRNSFTSGVDDKSVPVQDSGYFRNRSENSSSQRPKCLSMHDLRESSKDIMNETDNATNSANNDSSSELSNGPGYLLRHKPLLDLSADNLDITDETDSGVVMYESVRRSRERRSQSCDDITNCDKQTPDSESFYSCTDMTESEIKSSIHDTNLTPTKTKAHSCDDILNETDNILIDSGLKNKEVALIQCKKEVRKAKVKSLSSSHDALSMFCHMETLDIEIGDELLCQEKAETKDNVANDISKITEDFKSEILKKDANEIQEEVFDSEQDNVCDNKSVEKLEAMKAESGKLGNNTENETLTNPDKVEVKVAIVPKRRERTKSERLDRSTVKISSKPPLPRKTHRKVMSVSDIKTSCDQLSPTENKKRFSMIETSSKDSNVTITETKIGLDKNEHQNKNQNNKLTLNKKSQSCDLISSSTPKQTSESQKFLFDEEHLKTYTLKHKHTDKHEVISPIQKSVSSGNVPNETLDPRLSSNSSYSMYSLNRLSSQSFSDDVFHRLSSVSPPQINLPPPEKLLTLDGFIDFTGTGTGYNDSFSRFPEFPVDVPTPEVFPEMAGPDFDSVLKYDVCLGYLLHSVQCDNRIVCFYSFQRNKTLMESVITPLATLPGVQQKRSNESNHISTPKQPTKPKVEDLPNPAAPITSVPSERLLHAGLVLRTVLLARAPHMIRDRKFHLRTYRRCMVGTEMVDWLMSQCSLVHSRNQAVGMWQALVEEGVVVHVCHEHQFKDKYLFYRFHEDSDGVNSVPSSVTKRECEEELQEMFLMLAQIGPDAMMRMILRKLLGQVSKTKISLQSDLSLYKCECKVELQVMFLTLAQIGPDAMMRMILRKLPHERTVEDLEIIYEELLHIKALSHLSTMVKRELASVLVFESHAKSGTVLFNQGDEGKSWYIILKGSVNVVIYGKGVVCTLHEGDDFGKLALVNDAPRAATIVLRDDNCHFLRVDKDDFNRILRDVEANTVRLKEHGQDVLVLEKIPSNTQTSDGTVHAHYKYSVMAGTPEKMLEHLLETRLDNKKEDEIDGFLEDFILTHVIFMPCNHLCPVLLSHYHSSCAETSEEEAFEFMFNHKKCVLHFVQEWGNIVGPAFKEDHTINAFLEELHSCVLDDLVSYPSLKDDLMTLESVIQAQIETTENKSKKRISGNFTLSRKPSKDAPGDFQTKKKSIRPTDENIFKVYCADHTYSTLKLSIDTTVEKLLLNIKEKLGLGDDLILCEVKSSGERIIFKENDLCVMSGLSINGRLFVTPREHLDALTPLPEQEGPSEGTFTTIEMFSSREMAYYMTLYDWELFTSVQEYELIYQVFGRYKYQKITANLDYFLRRFNEIQFWVVTEMVLTTNLSKRVALLRKFIKLAAHCKEYQNLNSFFAVVMGLSNIAVSRLSQTWEKLPSKFKKMFVEFETLMDPSRNHRVYRLTVAKMAPPILPFMPLLMKDMTFTHEGNKTYFDGLVNFEKMRMISQTLKTVRFCRRANIDIEVPGSTKSADAMSYIRNLQVIDNQRLLTQLSHKLEPRKT